MGIANLVGIIITFIASFWKKILSKTVIVSFQFFFTSSLITFAVAFYFVVITTLVFIYNKINDIFDLIQNSFSNSALQCFYNVLHCSGIDVVFSTFFHELYAMFMTVLLFKLYFFTRHIMKMISDEMFKLGVLLGLN